jgi:hypothetical protein
VRTLITEEFRVVLYWDESTDERWWEVYPSAQFLMTMPAADIPGLTELLKLKEL